MASIPVMGGCKGLPHRQQLLTKINSSKYRCDKTFLYVSFVMKTHQKHFDNAGFLSVLKISRSKVTGMALFFVKSCVEDGTTGER